MAISIAVDNGLRCRRPPGATRAGLAGDRIVQSRILFGRRFFETVEWAIFSAAGLVIGTFIVSAFQMTMLAIPRRFAVETLPVVGRLFVPILLVVIIAVPGAFLGLMQRLILKLRWQNASFWVLSNASGLVMAVLFIQAFPYAPGIQYFPNRFILVHGASALAAGWTLGLITATPLQRILGWRSQGQTPAMS